MKHPYARSAVLCLFMAATTVFLANARGAELPVARESFDTFPMTIGPWQAVVDPPMDEDILRVLGVDDYLSRAYYQPTGAAVGLYVGFYASQRQGDTIHSPMNCLPGAGWEPVSVGQLEIPNVDGTGRNIVVNRYVIQKGLDRQLVLYWYQNQGRVVASEYWSKAYVDSRCRDEQSDGWSDGSCDCPAIRDEADGTEAETLARTSSDAMFPSLDGTFLSLVRDPGY